MFKKMKKKTTSSILKENEEIKNILKNIVYSCHNHS